jgi:hypothetical protein
MLRCLIACCVLAGTAHADGFYYYEAMGVSRVKDELGTYFGDGIAGRPRIGLGMRTGDWALEVNVSRVINAATETSSSADLFTYGLQLRRSMPLSRRWELYVRGNATNGDGTGELDGWEGRGLGFGAGVQLKGRGSVLGLLFFPLFFAVPKGPMMTGAIWLDDGYEFYRLHDHGHEGRAISRTAIDAQITTLSFGVGVGTDF